MDRPHLDRGNLPPPSGRADLLFQVGRRSRVLPPRDQPNFDRRVRLCGVFGGAICSPVCVFTVSPEMYSL
jgi:hypothetical protein